MDVSLQVPLAIMRNRKSTKINKLFRRYNLKCYLWVKKGKFELKWARHGRNQISPRILIGYYIYSPKLLFQKNSKEPMIRFQENSSTIQYILRPSLVLAIRGWFCRVNLNPQIVVKGFQVLEFCLKPAAGKFFGFLEKYIQKVVIWMNLEYYSLKFIWLVQLK